MLLSRMSETGNLGNRAQAYAEQLKYQEHIGTSEAGSSDNAVLSSYEVKLKGDTTSTGHKKNLSKTFDDVLNISTGNSHPVQDMPEIPPPSADDGVKYSAFVEGTEETEIVPAKDIEPKHRFANPDHLSFEPSAQPGAGASTSGQNNAYYPSHGTHRPGGGYYVPSAGQPSYHQYSYPPQIYQYSSNEPLTNAGYPMPPPPPALTPSSTDSRKHRREISEHQPVAHRRKNTYGELENTKWSCTDKDNEVDIMATIQDSQSQVSPQSDSPPATLNREYFRHQGYPHTSLPLGYYAQPISSAHSDSGASYNMGSGASVLPSYYGHYHSLRTSPNPEPYGQQQYTHEGYQGYVSYTTNLKSAGDINSQYSDVHHRTQSYAEMANYAANLKAEGDDDGHYSESHHRKQSSLGAFLATTGIFEDVFNELEAKGYDSAPENIEENTIQATTEPIISHNTDLSSSFLSKNLSDDAFFQQFYRALHEDEDAPVAAGKHNYSADNATSVSCLPVGLTPHPSILAQNPSKLVLKKVPSTGDVNRHRRKCVVETCQNRVVQGGLCISHGAKRKTCNFPGCTKNVKKQGKCSAHGPERKRCEAEGCVKVAVQGGKCISHGAKKKGCAVESCRKQSIIGGMCKKHYDEYHGVVKVKAPRKPRNTAQKKNPSPVSSEPRARGLSVFGEQDTVERILNSSPVSLGN